MDSGHPESTCERCQGPNVVWFAPAFLWNAVQPPYGVLCPVCFIGLAEAAGFNKHAWRIAPEFDMAPPQDEPPR